MAGPGREAGQLWDPLGAWPAGRRWLWAVFAIVLAVGHGPAFVRSLTPPRRVGRDFFQEWASARYLRDGLPVYTDLNDAIPRYLGYTDLRPKINVNAHPPTSILLAVPLARLDLPEATLIWNVISLGLLIASLWLVARQLAIPLSAWSIFPALVLLLLCGPLWAQVNYGQLNLVLLSLITGAWAADRNGRWAVAGALLGAATAIKLFPVFLFLYFVVRRQWKTVAAGLTGLLALTALTAMSMGWETYPAYVRDVLPGFERSQTAWGNASLVGLWRKLFDPASHLEGVVPLWRSPLLFRALVVVSAAAVVAVLVRLIARARTRLQRDQAFGLTLIGMLLLSPVTWNHSFLMLLLPLAVTWMCLPVSAGMRLLFLLILVGLWLDPHVLYEAFIPGGEEHGIATPLITLAVVSLQCYTLLTFFGLAAWIAVSTAPKHPSASLSATA